MSPEQVTLKEESASFTRYCIIGTIGFLIDAGLLLWFISLFEMNPYIARVLSILLALTMCWAMHRNWTFKTTSSEPASEWSRFAMVNGAGGLLNWVVYSLVLLTLPATTPLFALVIGSVVALIANYIGSRFWAFRP